MKQKNRKHYFSKSTGNAFTIVELLVVIVVIAILAAITIAAYSGISQRATAASMQSDMKGIATQLKMYQISNGTYPNSINDCPTPAANNICVKLSPGNSVIGYSANNQSGARNFMVVIGSGSSASRVTDKSGPTQPVSTMQPDVTPGAVVELHAAKANGGNSQGINSPLTTTWYDTSGNSNSGTLDSITGSPWSGSSTALDPYKLAFDGTDDSIQLPTSAAPGLADFSVEAWAWQPSGITDPYGIIYGTNFNGPTGWGIAVSNSTGSRYAFITTTNWNDRIQISEQNLSLDSWAHLVATFDRDGLMRLYVNGTEQLSGLDISSKSSLDLSTAPKIGNYPGWYAQFNGAAFRQYPFVLSQSQITANYNAGPDW